MNESLFSIVDSLGYPISLKTCIIISLPLAVFFSYPVSLKNMYRQPHGTSPLPQGFLFQNWHIYQSYLSKGGCIFKLYQNSSLSSFQWPIWPNRPLNEWLGIFLAHHSVEDPYAICKTKNKIASRLLAPYAC
jgi:hypothetical protein